MLEGVIITVLIVFFISTFALVFIAEMHEPDCAVKSCLEGKIVRHKLDHKIIGLCIRHWQAIGEVHIKFPDMSTAFLRACEVEIAPDLN